MINMEQFHKKTILNSSDYEAIISLLNETALTQTGEHIYINDTDKPTVIKLLAYFFQEEETLAQYNMSLKKGILLNGPSGCGKSTIIHIIRNLLHPSKKFAIRSCKRIASDFCVEGFDATLSYTRGSFEPYSSHPKTYCFDNLGQEKMGYYYGHSLNVLADILDTRHDYFTSCGMLTHITTDLDADELELRYTPRIRECMRVMFNVVSFDGDSNDKRR
jgi:energy-coupling factor transporter ATP-binding protein EcfA2